MSRSEKAFQRRLREIFTELGVRDREKGLQWFADRARISHGNGRASLSHAYAELLISLAMKKHRFLLRKGGTQPDLEVPKMHCDAGLGGLARWLRAAGVEAIWVQDIGDAELVKRAQELGGIVLTTDSHLLERRPIVSGDVDALWIPPTLTTEEQLRYVRAELNLPDIDSRCMNCGGELREVPKSAVRNRIPPRTFAWLDEFFECSACGKLFWNGTHWQRIRARIADADPREVP